jgi:hypothetical protein
MAMEELGTPLLVEIFTFARHAVSRARSVSHALHRATVDLETCESFLRLYAARSFSDAFWANHQATFVRRLPLRRFVEGPGALLCVMQRISRYENELERHPNFAELTSDAFYLELWRAELQANSDGLDYWID